MSAQVACVSDGLFGTYPPRYVFSRPSPRCVAIPPEMLREAAEDVALSFIDQAPHMSAVLADAEDTVAVVRACVPARCYNDAHRYSVQCVVTAVSVDAYTSALRTHPLPSRGVSVPF